MKELGQEEFWDGVLWNVEDNANEICIDDFLEHLKKEVTRRHQGIELLRVRFRRIPDSSAHDISFH
jgi:hypothetical protein